MNFSHAIDKYLIEILITKSKNHRVMSTQELEYWSTRLGKTPSGQPRALSKVTPVMIRDNLPTGVGPATKNRYLSALSAFYNVCIIDWELVKENPVAKVRRFLEPKGRVRYLSDDERYRLLEACRASKHPYLYVIVVIALSTGMRRTEITTLSRDQIDFNRQTLTLWDTKNKEPRVVPLVGLAHELVSKLPRTNKKLFPGSNIRYYWEKAVKEARVDNYTFHDNRHTAASYMAQAGVPLYTIGEILGHKSLEMTKRYAHLSTEHLRGPLQGLNDMMFK